MPSYNRLTGENRIELHALKKAGLSQKAIAVQLAVAPSTICRELQRNTGLRGYRPKQAQRLTRARRFQTNRHRISQARWQRVDKMIEEDWSPEQASGYLKVNGEPSVSPEWIYQHIRAKKEQGGSLHTHLRCQKKRRTRRGTTERRGQIIGRVCITERPQVVESRGRIGDWEADTVIGKQGGAVLVTLAERKSRFSMIVKAENKTAVAVCAAITKAMTPHADNVHTLTYDNGKEFAYHQKVSDALEAQGFFAHPYHSWERGLNENTNGLIRQYLPKGKSFDDLNDHKVQIIMKKLNNRPRKCLGFRTPNQVFLKQKYEIALAS
jgi:IS30 family transposase